MAVTNHLNAHGLPMLQVHNYCVSYRLRVWSLLNMNLALWDLDTTFSANQISESNLL